MSDLDDALLAAWEKIRAKLLSDPTELARRLARRRRAVLQRPPRAMCLAVRASDTRITPAMAIIVPEHAVQLNSREHLDRLQQHEVTLDALLLHRLCRPVYIEWPGEPWWAVAEKLGVQHRGLQNSRIKGVLRAHYVPGFGGRRGRPIPILYTDRPLDPSSRSLFAPIEPLWVSGSHILRDLIPQDLKQRITRVPVYRCFCELPRRLSAHHPEAAEPTEPRSRGRLAPPPPDPVWYKWKNGVFIAETGRRQR